MQYNNFQCFLILSPLRCSIIPFITNDQQCFLSVIDTLKNGIPWSWMLYLAHVIHGHVEENITFCSWSKTNIASKHAAKFTVPLFLGSTLSTTLVLVQKLSSLSIYMQLLHMSYCKDEEFHILFLSIKFLCSYLILQHLWYIPHTSSQPKDTFAHVQLLTNSWLCLFQGKSLISTSSEAFPDDRIKQLKVNIYQIINAFFSSTILCLNLLNADLFR